MFVASLKGRVLKVNDADADGLGDAFEVMSDDLPAPYGLVVNADSVDVLCKTSLIRLTQSDAAGEENSPYDQTVVADGWGYTSDYHDWAVGLKRDTEGGYYMALPCQQDERSEAAAQLRGHALKLIPYQSTQSPRAFRIETIAAGLRFPMGLALNSSGDLFATDNQGNYNPFNELNHLQFGKRYGFINKQEAKPSFAPDFESPAVNLPHPWTRSVNGLCFLETPQAMRLKGKENIFGAFEGDLIGCEYNGLSLIRMTLQKVAGQFQGAAYMFTRMPATGEATFEGPVTCEVSPDGGLFVGSIHDSGWGGGQNTGSIVRLRPVGELPLGIDEVRATATGFEIAFTQPVDAARAIKSDSYSIRSYRRISTPAYGGDDQDNRSEPVRELGISRDLKTVTLQLNNNLQAGYVYEINVGSVGPGEAAIFPSQAHYTLRAVPID
jgi:glucose/arabinose dehydrogenase